MMINLKNAIISTSTIVTVYGEQDFQSIVYFYDNFEEFLRKFENMENIEIDSTMKGDFIPKWCKKIELEFKDEFHASYRVYDTKATFVRTRFYKVNN